MPGNGQAVTGKHHSRCSCTSLEGVEEDLLAIWPTGDEFASSSMLVSRLIEAFPEVWSADSCYGRDLTVQRLGRYLARERGRRSTKNSQDLRGYCRSHIEELIG